MTGSEQPQAADGGGPEASRGAGAAGVPVIGGTGRGTVDPSRIGQPEDPLANLRPLLTALTASLAVVLPATRPLVWDGDPLQPANLAWWVVCVVAMLLTVADRRPWRIGPAGLLAALAVLVLAPAAWRAAEGAPGWALWGQWLLIVLYAGWLGVQAQDRPRLLWAGVLAGVVGEVAISLMQWTIVQPAMLAADQAGTLGIASSVDLTERIRNGGVFGTFTLANTLGAFLVLVLPSVVATAWSAVGTRRVVAAVVGGVLALAAGGCLVLTGAKGAWLALPAGLAITWMCHGPGGPLVRWGLPAAGLAVAVAALALLPSLRAPLMPSVDVRLGYWRSATTLIAEAPLAGHGVGGLAAESGRVMQPGDEPTRMAHCEPLEAAVAGGVLAGLLVAALLVSWACRPTTPPSGPPAEALPIGVFILLPFLMLYLCVLDAFGQNLGWWPGVLEHGRFVMYGWSILVGGALAACVPALLRAPLPPAWAVRAGLAAAALHACIDFDLQAAGLLGTIAALAALSGGTGGWTLPRLVPVLALTVAGALLVLGWVQSYASLDGKARQDAIAEARRDGPPIDPAELDATLARAAAATLGDRGLALELTLARRPGMDRLDASRDLAARLPHSAVAWRLVADDLAATGDWDAAVEAAGRMAANSPTDLKVLRYQAGLIGHAATVRERAGSHAAAATLRAQAEALRGRIADLEPRVHFRMR
jgi:hypothetical protein